MFIPYPKGGNIFCTCVKDNIIREKDQYEAVRLCGFDSKLFEEEEDGGIQEVLYGYYYLNHLIKLWPGYWVNQISKMNEVVGDKNHLDNYGGNKRLVCPFRRQYLCKCIGFILSEII